MKEGRVAFVNTTQKNKNKNAFGRIEMQYVHRNGCAFGCQFRKGMET